MGLASLAASGGAGARPALAAASGAHQSARLGSAARARPRFRPAAAGAGGGGRDRRIRLRRPHLRRGGVVAALLALRAGAAGARLRDRLHPLPAGSRCLPLFLARCEAGRVAACCSPDPFTRSGSRRAISANRVPSRLVGGAAVGRRRSADRGGPVLRFSACAGATAPHPTVCGHAPGRARAAERARIAKRRGVHMLKRLTTGVVAAMIIVAAAAQAMDATTKKEKQDMVNAVTTAGAQGASNSSQAMAKGSAAAAAGRISRKCSVRPPRSDRASMPPPRKGRATPATRLRRWPTGRPGPPPTRTPPSRLRRPRKSSRRSTPRPSRARRIADATHDWARGAPSAKCGTFEFPMQR